MRVKPCGSAQKVLTVGDTATYAMELLGTPAHKEPVENTCGAFRGERWQYPRGHDRVVIVTILAGKVSNIEERDNQGNATIRR